MDSQLPSGESVARRSPSRPGGNAVVLPMVVIMPRLRMARPSASVPKTEPPSESRTRTAPRALGSLAKVSNSRGVSAVMYPVAEIQTRQFAPQAWAGPSRRHSKRIGALPLSSWGVGGAEDAWTMPQASANALQTSRRMLTLINSPSRDASRSASVEGPSVPQVGSLFLEATEIRV